MEDFGAYVYCLYCGQPGVEWHHSTLRSQGGGEEANLVPLCRDCHDRRHSETLSVTRTGDVVTFLDKITGEIVVRRMVPQLATGPSPLVDEARAVRTWLETIALGGRLRQESDEALRALYDDLRVLKHRAWMAQAAVISEMQSRSSYGDNMARHVADALGCSERTVQARGQVYREIICKPEAAEACELLAEESFYREAVRARDPVAAINLAAERKAGDPSYSVARFREELRTRNVPSTLRRIVLVCEEPSETDRRIAESLWHKYGVPVLVQTEEPVLA